MRNLEVQPTQKGNLMKPLKLYKIEPNGLPLMHIAARSEEQAMQMYGAWEAAHELSGREFSVELVALDSWGRDQQLQLQALLATSAEGIARYEDSAGWVIDTDGWTSFDTDEMELTDVMHIFQMKGLTSIEAFVLASDYDRASELFEWHLRAHGRGPGVTLYREVALQHLDEPANDAVHKALDIGWEGLVTCDPNGRWAFVTPLGSNPPDAEEE